jgi:hypothetical protein
MKLFNNNNRCLRRNSIRTSGVVIDSTTLKTSLLSTISRKISSFIALTLDLRIAITFSFGQLFSVPTGRLFDHSVRSVLSLDYIHGAALKNPIIGAHACLVCFLLPSLVLDTNFSNYLGSNGRSGMVLKAVSRILTLSQRSIIRTSDGSSVDSSVRFSISKLNDFISTLLIKLSCMRDHVNQNPNIKRAS